jgi:TraY domain-containing protein
MRDGAESAAEQLAHGDVAIMRWAGAQEDLGGAVMATAKSVRKFPSSRAPLIAIDVEVEEKLTAAAAASGRSLTAETQFRLEQSFNDDAIMKELRLIRKLLQAWRDADNG